MKRLVVIANMILTGLAYLKTDQRIEMILEIDEEVINATEISFSGHGTAKE